MFEENIMLDKSIMLDKNMVHLLEVDGDSVEQCSMLKCTDDQCRFTNAPLWTLLQAAYDNGIKGKCKVYAIYNRETVVGMVRLDFSVCNDCYEFTNLIIGAQHQRKHYATAAIKEIVKIFRNDGKNKVIKLRVAKDNVAAIELYQKAGFIKQDNVADEHFYNYYMNI